MSPFLFWIFAVLTVIFAAAVVLNRNPVASALVHYSITPLLHYSNK